MIIYLLLITVILELIMAFYAFNKDLLSPAAIISEVYILSILACIYNIEEWGVNLHWNTYLVISFGNLIFIVVAFFIHRIFKTKEIKKDNIEKENNELKYISISKIKFLIILIIYIIFSILYIKANVSNIGGISNSSDAMLEHRIALLNEDILPGWLYAYKSILNICTYVLIYIFINNFIVNKKNKKNLWLLVPIFIFLFTSIFGAERATILLAFIYTLQLTYILLNRKYKLIKKINTKYIYRAGIILIIFFVLFGQTKAIFGRGENGDAISHVTYYIGNSIEALDTFLQNPSSSSQFGEELFRSARVYLSRMGLAKESLNKSGNLEFRYNSNGIRVGNVYTAYRKYIHDFGYISIIFFQIILSVIISIWYEKIKRRRIKDNIDFSLFLYCVMCLPLFRHSIQETFFSGALIEVFRWIVIGMFWKWFLTKIKVTYGYKRIL